MESPQHSEAPKHIIVIAYLFLPWNHIAVRRPESFIKAWSKRGHTITLITSSPNTRVTVEDQGHVRYVYIPCIVRILRRYYANNLGSNAPRSGDSVAPSLTAIDPLQGGHISVIKKLYSKIVGKRGIILGSHMPSLLFFWALGCLFYLRKHRRPSDVIFPTSPPQQSLWLAKVAKWLFFGKNTILVLDHRDAWAKDPLYKGLWPFTLFERYLEGWVNRSGELVLRACESIDFWQDRPDTIYIPNGMDYSKVDDTPPLLPLPPDRLNLLYTGSIYDEQNWLPLFEALRWLKKEGIGANKIKVQFLGSVTAKFLLTLERLGLQDVVTMPSRVDFEESLRIQRYADVCLFFPFTKDPRISTGKIFEYLAIASEVWSIGVTEMVGPNRFFHTKKVGKILGSDSQIIAHEIRHALDLKLTGQMPRPLPVRYFQDIDREVLANSVLDRILKIPAKGGKDNLTSALCVGASLPYILSSVSSVINSVAVL